MMTPDNKYYHTIIGKKVINETKFVCGFRLDSGVLYNVLGSAISPVMVTPAWFLLEDLYDIPRSSCGFV